MSCAHSFGEWCPGCIDGLVQDYNRVRKELAALKAQAPPAPATSAPTVEQIKALRERHGATNQTWIYGFDEAIDAVLALYADTRQPQTEPTPTPAYLRRASVLVNAPVVLRLRSIRAGMAAEGRTNTLLSAETIDEVLALFAPAAPTPEPQDGTCSLKPCADFVEGRIPEYCRMCNWSWESHRQAPTPDGEEGAPTP
jgi:hypothetical protein